MASAEMFVGRRRELQACLAVLRSHALGGVLIHGLGRQGKSSLAARLANRLKGFTLVVVYGEYHPEAILRGLLDKLRHVAPARAALEEGLVQVGRLVSAQEQAELLERVLFALWEDGSDRSGDRTGPILREPLLLLVDDLERLLDQSCTSVSGRLQPHAETLPVLQALLRAFEPSLTESRLLLTSRFVPVVNDGAGRDLITECLHILHLPPMSNHAQNKLSRRQLELRSPDRPPDWAERAQLLQRVPELSLGNPGLQDLLGDKIVLSTQFSLDTASTVLEQLASALAGESTADVSAEVVAFIHQLALGDLLNLAGPTGRALLRLLTAVELPIPPAVAGELASLVGLSDVQCASLLQRLLELGVVDARTDPVDTNLGAVAVTPLVRARLPKLSDAEATAVARALARLLFDAWGGQDRARRSYSVDRQLVRLALLTSDLTVLVSCAGDAVRGLAEMHRLEEAIELGNRCMYELEKAPGTMPLDLLANLSGALSTSGAGQAADEVLSKGERPNLSSLDDESLGSASRFLFEFGQRQVRVGELDEALRTYGQLLELERRRGNDHQIAVTQGKVADILQARGELDEARRLQEGRLSTNRKLGDADGIAAAQWSLAQLDLQQKLFQNAFPRLLEAFSLFDRMGQVDGIAIVGALLGQFLMAAEADEAPTVLGKSAAAYRKLGRHGQAGQVEALLQQAGVRK